MPLFSRIVLFGLVASYCLLNAYQSRETISQAVESGLEITIEYLIDLHSYIRLQKVQSTQAKFCKVAGVNNNYDLSEYQHECPHHRYITRIIQRSPLIIYIEQFLTQNEIQHLIELTEPFLKPSMTIDANGTNSINERRTSSSAYIGRHQTPIVECIERRFAQFQGDIDVERMESLQVVKYTPDQQYKPHYDWLRHPDLKSGGQRITTFFSYLQANCSMGETEFLDIQFNKPVHERFCDILICDEKSSELGIRFRPLPGNSIFWFNLDEYGKYDYLTYHAGRPTGENGQKLD